MAEYLDTFVRHVSPLVVRAIDINLIYLWKAKAGRLKVQLPPAIAFKLTNLMRFLLGLPQVLPRLASSRLVRLLTE